MQGKFALSHVAFEEIIQEEWENISQKLCHKLVNSMSTRVAEVILADGKKILKTHRP